MRATVAIDYEGMKVMAAELARLSGKDYATIWRSEGGSMIKIAALEAPIASLAKIKRDVKRKGETTHTGSGGEIYTNQQKNKGRVWFTDDSGAWRLGRGYMVFDAGPSRGHHLPDPLWMEYLVTAGEREAYIRARLAEITKRRGIERLSWLQMGDAVGVQLSAVAPSGSLQEPIARGARVRGRVYPNGGARDLHSGSSFMILAVNKSPVAVAKDGQNRMDRAMARRFRGFQIAAQTGLTEDLKRRSARWPGIFVEGR